MMREKFRSMLFVSLIFILTFVGCEQNTSLNTSKEEPVKPEKENEELLAHEHTIPKGGEYQICLNPNNENPDSFEYGKTLNSGEQFPVSPNRGDTYIYGDYIYTFQIHPLTYKGTESVEWCVRVRDKSQSEYGTILTSIDNHPVTMADSTFHDCTKIKKSPRIPDTITVMLYTYAHCTSLERVEKLPTNLSYMEGTFNQCYSLTDVPELPNNITSLYNVFGECKSLEEAPSIPESVTNMQAAFHDCTSLTYAPDIPVGVRNLKGTFANCSSLIKGPIIPHTVDNMEYTFQNCGSLRGRIEINAQIQDIDNFEDCFSGIDMSKVTLTGSCPILNELVNKLNK